MGEDEDESEDSVLLKDQCKYFAEHFAKYFEEKKESYYNEVLGITARNGQPLKILEPVGAGLRGASSAGVGITAATGVGITASLGAVFGVAGGLTTAYEKIGNYLANCKHMKKAEKVSDVLQQGEDKKQIRKVLVNAALEIYKIYEDPLGKLTSDKNWRIILRKLSRDAVDRVLDYIFKRELTTQNDEEKIEIKCLTSNFLVEAFIKGKSKGYMGNKIPKHKIPLLPKNWTFDRLDEKVGIKKTVNNDTQYYKRRKKGIKIKSTGGKNYGFRQSTEGDNLNDYQLTEVGENILKVIDEEMLSEQVLEKLDRDDPSRKSERLETNQEEIKGNIEEVKSKIDQLITVMNPQNEDIPIQFNIIPPVKSFTGRKIKLVQIHTALKNNNNSNVEISQTVAISGSAGMGKSELSRKYAIEYKNSYDGNLIWINSENQQSLKQSFLNLAKKLQIPTLDKTNSEKEQSRNIILIVEEVYKKFRQVKSLFIFDNVEELNHIKQYLPNVLLDENKPYVLITSRNNIWDVGQAGHIEIIALDGFTQEESVEFTKTALNISVKDSKYNKDIEELSEMLQNLPLALQQAVSYIQEQSKISSCSGLKKFEIRDYLNKFKDKSKELLNFRQEGCDRYVETLGTTWRVTVQKIKKLEGGKDALELLELIAYFSPDNINVLKCFGKFYLQNLVTFENENVDKLWKSIKILQQYSLIQATNGECNIHRLNQEVIRIRLQEKSKETKVLQKALELIISWDGENESHTLSILTQASNYGQLVDYFYTSKNFDVLTNALHLYAKYGCNNDELNIVKLLVEKGADKNKTNSLGHTPLYSSAQNNNLDILKYLIEKGCEINLTDKDDWTPLHSASFNGNSDVVKLLLKNNANVNAEDMEGWTPLHNASYSGYLEIVKILVRNQADINHQDEINWTPLHGAASNGHLDVVEFLIKNGADVKLCDKRGRSALHRAALHSHINVVQYLVESGADVTCANNYRWTVLHNATQSGNFEMVKYLVEKGADVKCVDQHGWSPLRTASKFACTNIINYFLENGADVNIADKYGCTPLHTVSRNGKIDIVELLLKKGAGVNICDKDGWRSLHNASLNGHLEIVKILVENGADVNCADKNGITPLHSTARTGQLEIAKYLIEKGADFNLRDNYNQRALEHAKDNGFEMLEEYFLELEENSRIVL